MKYDPPKPEQLLGALSDIEYKGTGKPGRIVEPLMADPKMVKHSKTTRQCKRLVLDFFDSDLERAILWFATPNPLLGDVSPNYMMIVGRADKLLSFIEDQLELNRGG